MNVAFVPVRLGSKSIPKKNIRNFCGKPLVYWILNSLQCSKSIHKIFLATESDEIASIVKDFGFDKVEIYKRNLTNATDIASTESVILEFLSRKQDLKDNDIFVLAQATSPFTQPEDIDNALMKFINDKADSLLTCVRVKRFFWNEDGTPINYDYKNRPRRQEFHGTLMENGALYISTVGNLKKYKNRLGGRISIYIMDWYKGIELDEEDDWIIGEYIMRKYIIHPRVIKNIKLFFADVDGTLTDGGIYYSAEGEELKKFNTQDGKAFELLREKGIKVGLITSEISKIVEERAKKLKVDYYFCGVKNEEKLNVVREVCRKENIPLENVAYIGDDVNCKELLSNVGLAACPANAVDEIKNIPGIIKLSKKGGEGAVREFAEIILKGVGVQCYINS